MMTELLLVSAVMRTFWNTPRGRPALLSFASLSAPFLSAKLSKEEAVLPPLPLATPLLGWELELELLLLEALPAVLTASNRDWAPLVPGASWLAALSAAVP